MSQFPTFVKNETSKITGIQMWIVFPAGSVVVQIETQRLCPAYSFLDMKKAED